MCFDCGAGSPPGKDGAPAKSCCACFRHFFAKPATASGGGSAGKKGGAHGASKEDSASKKAKEAVAAAERKAKAAEARADAERKARIAAEAEAAKARAVALGSDDGMGELSAEQADRQKVLRAELKELKAVSPALYVRFFGGADGHAAAVRAIQDELTAVAAAKRGGMPLADQLDSQRRFVDACVKADSAAVAQLDVLLAKREELEEQIAAGRGERDKAAEKRASAEAHLYRLNPLLFFRTDIPTFCKNGLQEPIGRRLCCNTLLLLMLLRLLWHWR